MFSFQFEFQNMTDTQLKTVLCSPAELVKYIQVPAVFKLDYTELSNKLCLSSPNFNITQLREVIDLATLAFNVSFRILN